MTLIRHVDCPVIPQNGENAETAFERAGTVIGTPGEDYLHKRCIPLHMATDADLRYSPSWNGRPAVLAAMRTADGDLMAVHGRYLSLDATGTKMLTVGQGGGVVSVLNGLRTESLILVEGLFDALSLAACGLPSVGTIGRWADGLPQWAAERTVLLAFDGNKVGDRMAEEFARRLVSSDCHRLKPPGHSKDWNTALCKMGQQGLSSWLSKQELLVNKTG